MKRLLCLLLLLLLLFIGKSFAQYDSGAINYGIVSIKNLGLQNEVGFGGRIEYALNCYTTFLGEYNRLFSIGSDKNVKGYNELGFVVNLIMFNWYPTTITSGLGYIVNDSDIFKTIEKKAYLAFRSGDFNHGAQVKVRALYQISKPLHVFLELNIKSLGRRYDTLLIGFNYDF